MTLLPNGSLYLFSTLLIVKSLMIFTFTKLFIAIAHCVLTLFKSTWPCLFKEMFPNANDILSFLLCSVKICFWFFQNTLLLVCVVFLSTIDSEIPIVDVIRLGVAREPNSITSSFCIASSMPSFSIHCAEYGRVHNLNPFLVPAFLDTTTKRCLLVSDQRLASQKSM